MVSTAGVREEIERANSRFVAAFKRGDAAGIAALYQEDAKLLPPGGTLQTGRAAIQQFWQGAMDMGIKEADLQTQDVEASGDLAYEVGAAVLTIEPAGGEPMTDTVKYVVVWKRASGAGWQLAIDIWNANA